MFDLAFAIPSISTESISVTRYVGSYDSSGVWSQSTSTTITGRASIQPLNGIEVQRLPENMRYESSVRVWFDKELQPATEGGLPGDRFTWNGDVYQIQAKVDWSGTGNYFEYLARKIVD